MMEGSNGRCIGTAWPSTNGSYPRLSDSGAGQGSHIQVIFASAPPPVPDDDRSDTSTHHDDSTQRRRARETLLDDGNIMVGLVGRHAYKHSQAVRAANTMHFSKLIFNLAHGRADDEASCTASLCQPPRSVAYIPRASLMEEIGSLL